MKMQPQKFIFEAAFLYVGHIPTLTGCKSLYAPRWKEAIATGKGVAGDCKSEGSHSQRRGNDGQKPDIRLNRGGKRAMDCESPRSHSSTTEYKLYEGLNL